MTHTPTPAARRPDLQRTAKAIRNEDKAERYYFVGYLKADGGIDKLESTVANLPEITLEPAELKKAMQQAL